MLSHYDEILRRWRPKLLRKQWLRIHLLEKTDQPKVEDGKRSDIIHRMEHELRELGVSEEECFCLVWRSGYCKYRFDRRDGEKQLWNEITTAYEKKPNGAAAAAIDDEIPPEPRLLIDIPIQPNRFLWWPYLPAGEAVIFAGPGGIGKGLAATDIAARVTRGGRWPLSRERAEAGNVLWMEQEDNIGKTVRARMEAAKADMNRMIMCDARTFHHWIDRDFIIAREVRLVVLSPLLSAMELENSISEVAVRRELERLSSLYVDLPCTLLGLMHPNKKHDQSAIDRISGTTAFTTFPRGTLILNKEKRDDEEEESGEDDEWDDNKFRLTHQKHNLSSRGDDLIGARVNTREDLPRGAYFAIEWSRADGNIDIETALDRKRQKKKEDRSAGEWLREYLKRHGPSVDNVIKEAAERRGLIWNTVKVAKQRFGADIEHENTKEVPSHVVWRWVGK
jgi:hypothetical protein